MESEDDEQYIYLAREDDIDRSEEEEQDSVGQKQQTEHLAGIAVFLVVEEIIYSSYSDIAYEGAQKAYEEQYQRQERIDRGSCLLTECAGEHAAHERIEIHGDDREIGRKIGGVESQSAVNVPRYAGEIGKIEIVI